MKITYQGTEVDLAPPWKILTMDEALIEVAGIDKAILADDAKVIAIAKEKGIQLEEQGGAGQSQDRIVRAAG